MPVSLLFMSGQGLETNYKNANVWATIGPIFIELALVTLGGETTITIILDCWSALLFIMDGVTSR